MDDAQLCLDTSVLIAYLKGREPGASAVERVRAALLPAVLGDPPTASPVPAGIPGLPGEPGLLTAREQDDGKPLS